MNLKLKSGDTERDDPLDTLAYVVGSKYRRMIIRELRSGPSTPTQIAEKNDAHVSHVSRGLGELEDRTVVAAYGTGSRTRLYRLTDYGDTVAGLLEDFEGDQNG